MAAGFDPQDRHSWYFGPLSRSETNDILLNERDSGVFLVRDSNSIKGDFVLCVREDSKVSHYIINRIGLGDQTRYRIGDQEFNDLPALLTFYKTHYLDTTSLTRPAPRMKVVGKFDFAGKDQEDLPFKKGEILTILTKDEELWWNARNSQGDVGLIPVPYIKVVDPNKDLEESEQQCDQPQGSQPEYRDPNAMGPAVNAVPNGQQRKLPARARVTQQRIPNAYDKTALRLEVGDIVLVTKMHINGQWEGKINGREGHFPFTHVKFIDSDNADDEQE